MSASCPLFGSTVQGQAGLLEASRHAGSLHDLTTEHLLRVLLPFCLVSAHAEKSLMQLGLQKFRLMSQARYSPISAISTSAGLWFAGPRGQRICHDQGSTLGRRARVIGAYIRQARADPTAGNVDEGGLLLPIGIAHCKSSHRVSCLDKLGLGGLGIGISQPLLF